MMVKQLITFAFICCGLSACYMANQSKPRYTKLSIVHKLPMVFVQPDSSLKGEIINDSVCITYAGDFIIYDLIYHYQEEVDDSLVFDGIKSHYFIFKKGQSHGHFFKTLTDDAQKRLSVDSLKQIEIDVNFELPQQYGNVPRSIVYNKMHEVATVKLYPPPGKQVDSLYLGFSKQYANLGHSLCPQTDAQYGSTLYKISMFLEKDTTIDAAYMNKFKLVTTEMVPLKVDNEKELDAFVERYKKLLAAKR
jgi:hypothetical protein